MGDTASRFEVGAYSGVLGGYPVRLNDCTWHVAIFIQESEAEYFVAHANAQFQKHGITDMSVWDTPDHDGHETEDAG